MMERDLESQLQLTLRQLADLKFALDESTLVTITDALGTIIYVNDKFCEISGYPRDQLIGRNHRMTKSGYHSKEFFNEMWDIISSGRVWRGEIKNRKRNGDFYWVDSTIVPFINDQGLPYQYIAIRTDITKSKDFEQKITHMAYHDALTGLANRRLLNKRLTQLLTNCSMFSMTAVILIDLDNFKVINDSFGHQTGDHFLKMVSERIKKVARPDETLARIGGDEFVLAIPSIDSEEMLVNRCSELLEKMKKPFQINGIEFFVTLSIGASYTLQSSLEADELIKRADKAMYYAKGNGKNSFQIFEPHMLHDSLQRLELEAKLRKAIEQLDFVLYYQPKIDAEFVIHGFEALIRWRSSNGQIILPKQFIPLAEENGLIGLIGDWVLHTACMQLRRWMEMGLPSTVIGINLSPLQFQQENFVEKVIYKIKEYNINPASIELEITEGILMKNPIEATYKLQQLKDLGIKISMDDFGTAFSSLNYLKEFPIDIIKIDRSFIQDIETDAKARTIVHSIINLAHNLDVKVTAEGVETKNQFNYLKEMSCDYVQGYYFSRPKDASEITNLFMNKVTTY